VQRKKSLLMLASGGWAREQRKKSSLMLALRRLSEGAAEEKCVNVGERRLGEGAAWCGIHFRKRLPCPEYCLALA